MLPLFYPAMLAASDNPSYVNQARHDRAGYMLMPINGRFWEC
jgi:hypothetical protein